MIIDGKEIEFFTKYRKIPEKYYEVLSREVRLALNSLSVVQEVRTQKSRSTDSIYFKIKIKHMDELYTLSLRSHFPKEAKEFYLYYYTPNFHTLTELTKKIKIDILKIYNRKAEELGIRAVSDPEKDVLNDKNKPRKKKEIGPKLKGTKSQFLSVQQQSFDDFFKQFNESKEDQKR